MMKPFDIIIIFLLVAVSFSPMSNFAVQNSQNEGDKIYAVISLVNGTIRPYIEVGQEWVRLRVVNGSNARNYQLRLSDESFFYQIATDGGFLETPVERKEFLLSPGERAEIVVDMSKYKVGEEVSLVDISTTEIIALQ